MEWDREQEHDRKLCEEFVNRPSSPETERIFARFMTSGSGQPPSPNNTIHCSLLLRHSSSPARPFSRLWEDVTMPFQNEGSVLEGHLSLPDYSKSHELLRLSHSVPCKISAKRGCATHPRSIAERVRRTRISERIRKLQEHVPNIDKQANTSEMLDLAIEYIKDLQKQVQALSNDHKNCSCDKH